MSYSTSSPKSCMKPSKPSPSTLSTSRRQKRSAAGLVKSINAMRCPVVPVVTYVCPSAWRTARPALSGAEPGVIEGRR